MPTVKVGDINIYYEIHGEGEPLVIIPGLASSMDMYFMHIPVFSQEYQVVGLDTRGAGRSDAPDIPYTREIMADDISGLIDAIGVDAAHIWGISMGGAIAQLFALRYPERVRSLILASTGPPTHGVRTTDPEVIEHFQHPDTPPEESLMETLRISLSQKFIDKNPDLIKQLIAKRIGHPTTPEGRMRQMQATTSTDVYGRLPEIKAPTLVIHGDADRIVPVENARILASRIPGAELAILKEMGHGLHFEAFEENNRIILDFLRRHRRSE